jgi:hypothetical protein
VARKSKKSNGWRNKMELKKGDKLIFEPAKVVGADIPGGVVHVRFGGGKRTRYITPEELKHCVKVLGLLGDEGLEAEVGMEVYDSTFGHGKITVIWGTGIGVEFNGGGCEDYIIDGKLFSDANRTLYVTKKPEKLGWAWVREEPLNHPHTYTWRITREKAEELFGENLIHWIPE